MNLSTLYTIAFLLLAGLSTFKVMGQNDLSMTDWPQWRGPDRSGTWHNGPRIDSLTGKNVSRLWEAPVGSGYCGPTVANGLVYVMDLVEGSERVVCIDSQNGKTEWVYSYPADYSVGYPTGPRASVTISSDKAYAWGTMGHLHCLDAKTGKLLWKINTTEKYQCRIPIWGMASNPIVYDNLLIVQVGGVDGACMVGFNKDTGEEVWRALDDEASYSSPILISQAGEQVLACWTGGSITGLDPKNGSVHWSIPFKPLKTIINIPDPVYDPPYLFLSGFYDGSFLLELDQQSTSAKQLYHRRGASERDTDALHCCISTPTIGGDFIYGIDSYGEARCLDLETGDRIWEDLTLVPSERWGNVHMVKQGELVWGFNESGELLLGKFTPEGYRDLGRVLVIDPVKISPNPRNGVNWAHPAFSGNRVFVRSDSMLVCLQIKER
ncbi:MAG: PQQ-binding-like beta-propeller repeat protein [Bacteroidetes bacterium]|nr:PQQ-binding-like beta-propeller repeat protein [Bacteroidota bacterium]